ncbi:MAG: T9SS type A sorting domain-containing protein, partial [Melioribacter sp.]|nr:T9SS type A sorting domain-containing protein [Melioribacter sp.]
GKFSGNFPVDITVFGKYRTTNEKYSITLTENDIVHGSELVATTWYGKHIQSLLKLPYDPLTISNIIDLGIEENILTPYTGFLVFNLETSQGTNTSPSRDGEKDWANTDVNDESKADSINFAVNVFPNPFNPSTTINFKLPANGKVIIRVYNILGEIVNELINKEMNAGNHSIIFNGSNLSSGIYILVISFEGGRKSYFAKQKLLLMK